MNALDSKVLLGRPVSCCCNALKLLLFVYQTTKERKRSRGGGGLFFPKCGKVVEKVGEENYELFRFQPL